MKVALQVVAMVGMGLASSQSSPTALRGSARELDQQSRGKLFLYFDGWSSISSPPSLPSNAVEFFDTVAIVAPNSPDLSTAKVEKLWNAVESSTVQLLGLKAERWLKLDFSVADVANCDSGLMNACNGQCTQHSQSDCTAQIATVMKAYASLQVVGIVYDNEGAGNPKGSKNAPLCPLGTQKIVAGLQAYATQQPVSLAWTAAMGDVKLSNPLMLYKTVAGTPYRSCKDASGQDLSGCSCDALASVEWTHSIGEAYSLGGAQAHGLYPPDGCAIRGNINPWLGRYGGSGSNNNTGLFPFELLTEPGHAGNAHSRAVPMVCGGGNCQEKYPPCEDLDGDVLCPDHKVCIDERLDTNALSDLLSKRPSPQSATWCVDIYNAPAPVVCKKTDPFPNFAIWYGEGADPCCPKAAASKDTCQANLGSQSWTCP